MFSLVAAIVSLCALTQASHIYPRQTQPQSPSQTLPPLATGAPDCCFLFVNAFGAVNYVTTSTTVTLTVITEVVVGPSVIATRTITISNGVTLSPSETLTETDLTRSIISSAIVTPTPSSTPDVGNTGIEPQPVTEAFKFNAPAFYGDDGAVRCETAVSSITRSYTIPSTFVVTATASGNPFLSAEGWLRYNAQYREGEGIVFPALDFQLQNDAPPLPEQLINWMRRVPEIVAKYPELQNCVVKTGTTSTTSTVTQVNSDFTSSTRTVTAEAQLQTTSAPFINQTRSSTIFNTPLTRTSTVWVGGNFTIPLQTGGAAQGSSAWIPMSMLEGFVALMMYLM